MIIDVVKNCVTAAAGTIYCFDHHIYSSHSEFIDAKSFLFSHDNWVKLAFIAQYSTLLHWRQTSLVYCGRNYGSLAILSTFLIHIKFSSSSTPSSVFNRQIRFWVENFTPHLSADSLVILLLPSHSEAKLSNLSTCTVLCYHVIRQMWAKIKLYLFPCFYCPSSHLSRLFHLTSWSVTTKH